MIYQIRILKGLFNPIRSFFQLEKAEAIYGLRMKIFWLFLVSALVFAISGWIGVGTHVISPQLVKLTAVQYEGLKSYFVVGRFLLGLLYAGVILYLPPLLFGPLTNTSYSKLVVMQAFVLPILLMEQVTFILLAIGLDLPWYSSPLSLGVIAQYITVKKYIIFLLGCVSIFKLWVIAVQYRGLRMLTTSSPRAIAAMVISFQLVFWSISAFFAYVNFYIIL
ncbi:hypothetical protein [Bacillus sp. FSL K6-3431]|uniref:hypothetical protein n=1 Tax=Bacillus sp. FSL K6-3431 TaxID=2921500 RepID=UPI0030FB0857